MHQSPTIDAHLYFLPRRVIKVCLFVFQNVWTMQPDKNCIQKSDIVQRTMCVSYL